MIRILLADWAREHQAFAAAIVNAIRLPPAPPWVSWSALSAVLGVVGFLWTQYQGYLDWRTDMVTNLARLETETKRIDQAITSVRDIEDQRHLGENRQLADLDRRIDVHRDDIRALQISISQHFDKGK